MKFFKKKNKDEEVEKIKKVDKKVDKKVKNKKSLEKQINSKKVNKLIKFNYFKIIRVILWTLISILLIRGGVSLFKVNDFDVIMADNKKFLSSIEDEKSLELRVLTFAEDFARDYFTRYPKNQEDFKNRIQKFTTEKLATDMNNLSYSEIINASSFYFEKYSDTQYTVSVKAKIKQFVPKAGQEKVSEDKKVYENSIYTEYIEVPIYIDIEGKMIVEDIPRLIAAPAKADLKTTDYSGVDETDSAVVAKINEGLVEFFKAYYGGEQAQLNFLLENEDSIKVVSSGSKFEKLNNTKIYKLKDNEHLAIVELTIKSFNNEFKQRLNLTITKNGDKYLVKNLDTRISNLNIN